MKEFFLTGDSPFFSIFQLRNLSWLPSVWHEEYGLGVTDLPRLWLEYPFRLIVKFLSVLGFQWFMIEKICWVGFILLACIGMYKLIRFFHVPKLFSVVGGLFFVCNTYVFLLINGGQIGVCFGYASIPWIILGFLQGFGGSVKERIWCGFVVSLSMMADLRLALLGSIAGSGIAFLLSLFTSKRGIGKKIVLLFGTILLVILPIHAFWLIPLVLFPNIQFGNDAYTTGGMAQFLSFADFSHALSFLHPNWPENLFGKVYFLQPEFLLVPIVAFGSLIFIHEKHESHESNVSYVLFFSLLAIVAVFFAKGSNPPFGELYLWCIGHVPGFVLFRDSTKFYAIIGCMYAFLIAHTGAYIAASQKQNKRLVSSITAGVIICFCFVLVRNVFQGNIIRSIPISREYAQLENMLNNEKRFFRVLWIPTNETFSPMSNIVPGVTGEMIFQESSPSAMTRIFSNPSVGNTLAKKGIQYIVVIPDERKSQYLTEYQFDPKLRDNYLQAIENNPSFEKNTEFTHLQVFRSRASADPVLSADGIVFPYKHPSNGIYRIQTEGKLQRINFLFQHDPYWQATDGTIHRSSQKDENGFMVFDIVGMDHALTLNYLPEQVSRAIAPWSIIFFICISVYLLIPVKKKHI